MTSDTPQDLAELHDAVGKPIGNAIAKFVDGRIAAAFEDNRTQLEGLINRVQELYTQQGPTPQVRQAAEAVADATDAHNDAASQAAPSQADVQADAARVQRAAQVVDAADSSQEPATPASPVNAGGNDQSGLEGRVSSLESSVSGLQASVEGANATASAARGTASRAMAVAIAASGGGSRRANAIKVFLGVLVASVIVYWLLAASRDNLDWNWFDQVAWPIGLAAAVSYIAYLFLPTTEDQMASQAHANAQASAGDDGDHHQGLAGVLPWRRAHGHAQADGDQSAHSGAQANVSHGHVHSGANASAH